MKHELPLEQTRAKITLRNAIVRQIMSDLKKNPRNVTFVTLPAMGWVLEWELSRALSVLFPDNEFEFICFERNYLEIFSKVSQQNYKLRPFDIEESSWESWGRNEWAHAKQRVSGRYENCTFHYINDYYSIPRKTTHKSVIAWADFCGTPKANLVNLMQDALNYHRGALIYFTFSTLMRHCKFGYRSDMVKRGLFDGWETASELLTRFFNDGRRHKVQRNFIFDYDYKGGKRGKTHMKTMGFKTGAASTSHIEDVFVTE